MESRRKFFKNAVFQKFNTVFSKIHLNHSRIMYNEMTLIVMQVFLRRTVGLCS